MGYMGLNNWTDSDYAADAYGAVVSVMLKELNERVKEEGNSYNTSGPVNLALIIESGLLDNVWDYYIQEKLDHKAIVDGLKKHIAASEKDKADEWGDEKNRLWHNKSFKRMLKNVKKFLTKKGIEVDA